MIESTLERKELAPNVYHVHFRHRRSLCSTFLRLQEHYESPKFRGKVFSLEEYKKWYVTFAPRAKKTGTFTYYGDWSGFNVPSRVFEPFFEGKFDPLSPNERQLLNTFSDLEGSLFYVIGTFGDKPKPAVLKHEIAHGLFATNQQYQKAAIKVVTDAPPADKKKLLQYLASSGGYHPSVYLDETHAYFLASCDFLLKKGIVSKSVIETQKKLDALFEKYSK